MSRAVRHLALPSCCLALCALWQGTIGELDSHSAEMVAKGVQDLLICTEMLMAAIAFTFTFPITGQQHPGRHGTARL